MSNQTKYNNLNYLIDSTFIMANRLFVFSLSRPIDYLGYYLKMKTIEHHFQSIIHQMLQQMTSMYWLMEKVFFWHSYEK